MPSEETSTPPSDNVSSLQRGDVLVVNATGSTGQVGDITAYSGGKPSMTLSPQTGGMVTAVRGACVLPDQGGVAGAAARLFNPEEEQLQVTLWDRSGAWLRQFFVDAGPGSTIYDVAAFNDGTLAIMTTNFETPLFLYSQDGKFIRSIPVTPQSTEGSACYVDPSTNLLWACGGGEGVAGWVQSFNIDGSRGPSNFVLDSLAPTDFFVGPGSKAGTSVWLISIVPGQGVTKLQEYAAGGGLIQDLGAVGTSVSQDLSSTKLSVLQNQSQVNTMTTAGNVVGSFQVDSQQNPQRCVFVNS